MLFISPVRRRFSTYLHQIWQERVFSRVIYRPTEESYFWKHSKSRSKRSPKHSKIGQIFAHTVTVSSRELYLSENVFGIVQNRSVFSIIALNGASKKNDIDG